MYSVYLVPHPSSPYISSQSHNAQNANHRQDARQQTDHDLQRQRQHVLRIFGATSFISIHQLAVALSRRRITSSVATAPFKSPALGLLRVRWSNQSRARLFAVCVRKQLIKRTLTFSGIIIAGSACSGAAMANTAGR